MTNKMEHKTDTKLELLAPAGGMLQFIAALENGADAVYLGLESLNARRGASNFTPELLTQAVGLAHGKGARVFLTLNIMLNCREIGKAARSLELARKCGVDAVLVTDPALLLFMPHYPELEFHFSTQAAISSSAGVRAAEKLGIKRVVLARELSCDEIKAASTCCSVETEVFVQGALCMAVSGRCLLSSWGGGRSGNRGVCTSPCRVDWRVAGTDKRVVLSMRDLCLGEHLDEIGSAGVRCLKIEGRLKNADWVGRAVSLYRRSIDVGSFDKAVAASLGDYTGRSMTDGYFVNSRGKMLGVSGREAAEQEAAKNKNPGALSKSISDSGGTYDLKVTIAEGKALCILACEGEKSSWHMPLSKVRHEKRALSLLQVGQWLSQMKVQKWQLDGFDTDYPDVLVPKNFANKLLDNISKELRLLTKPREKIDINSIELPESVRELTRRQSCSLVNERRLGNKVNLLRLFYEDACKLLRDVRPELVVIADATPECAEIITQKFPEQQFAFSLPAVIYENMIQDVSQLCVFCAQNALLVEVNGWDGWFLAQEAGCEVMGGAGMAVLNSHAAFSLSRLGFKSVSYSLEAGQTQLEDLSASMPMAATLWVYGYPVLVSTRCEIPLEIPNGTVIEDSRGIRLTVQREGGLTHMHPQRPFDISSVSNEKVCARWIGADLCGSSNVTEDWNNLRRQARNPEMFNYSRGLY